MRELGKRIPKSEMHLASFFLDTVRDEFIEYWDDAVQTERDLMKAKEVPAKNYDDYNDFYDNNFFEEHPEEDANAG
jgi:hypothetical protein